jgi:YVTN family beta-propeller protein
VTADAYGRRRGGRDSGLPGGAVTFLFTDIEGSTRLVKALRERYPQVLADHRRLIRAAVAAHDGHEVDTQGDAFFVAFAGAKQAVLCALAIQLALAAHAWPADGRVRVRIGIHTGHAVPARGGYTGLAVHRAARISAAARGGQVLVSQATQSIVEDEEEEDPGFTLVDLGEQKLKDLDRPVRLYQLAAPGLDPPALDVPSGPGGGPRLERAILPRGPSPELPAPAAAGAAAASAPARRMRRLWLVAADRKKRLMAVGGTVVLAVSVLVAVAARGGAHLVAAANTVGVIDTGQADLSAVVTGVGRPSGVASGVGAVWVTDSADDQLLRVDPAGQVDDRISVGRGPAGVAVGDGQVWVANQLDGTVSEVNPGAGVAVGPAIPVGIGPSAVAFGFGSVWVANVTSGTLTRIDAATGKVVATIPLGSSPAGVAFGFGSVWVAAQESGLLLRVDPAGDRLVQAIPAGQSPDGVAVGAGAVWVADAGGAVTRFDPRTGTVQTINVGGAPAGVAYADGAVWVANSLTGAVNMIDPRSGAVQLIPVGNEPVGLAAAGHHVWATVLPSLASHRGGTLTVIALQQPDPGAPTDPAVAYYLWTWQMLSMTNDGLVGYRRVAGLAGDQLVPDLATTLPVPTDGGTTYVFQLRSGIRYSNGQLVRPEDFRRAIERVFMIDNKRGGNPSIPPYAFGGIVGSRQCERSLGRCDLSRGIVTSDAANTVTFHLTAPDPHFLYKLAFSWAYAVPSGTPDHQISAAQMPATGPYLTRSLVPGHTWVLVRNPRFRPWSPQAQPGGYPDRIVLRFDVAAGQAVAEVEHGRADVLLSPPPGSVGQLATHYTSQLHSGPLVATIGLALNTRIPPFNSLDARRALNYAIDKNAVVALNGGPLTAQPTCQILPPTMPGYQPYCPYTLHASPGGAWTAPDLARAQQLVRASGTRGDRVTVPATNIGVGIPGAATARYVASVLDRLGYRASVRPFADYLAYSAFQADSRDRPQISFYSWYQDYPAPWDFIGPLFTCASFIPANPGNGNVAEFCDPRIDTQARQTLTLQDRGLASAAPRWATIDHKLVDQAPWVPLYNPRVLTVLSARVGNYQFHPYWNLLIDQLWVR